MTQLPEGYKVRKVRGENRLEIVKVSAHKKEKKVEEPKKPVLDILNKTATRQFAADCFTGQVEDRFNFLVAQIRNELEGNPRKAKMSPNATALKQIIENAKSLKEIEDYVDRGFRA